MRDMLAEHGRAATPASASAAVAEYVAFLCRMRLSPVLVPTPIVDLVWHTHQLFPRAYQRECVRLAGHEVHHDDKIDARTCTVPAGFAIH